MTTKQRDRTERIRAEMRTGATGGIGYGARTGQIIRGALGRGAGGRFVRAAERETLRERDERLRALLAQIRAYLRTPAGQRAAGKRTRQRRQSAAQRRAKNRRDTVERIVARGWMTQEQATAFLMYIEGEALSEEQQAALEALGLLDAEGNLTHAGRLLKQAYDREKLDLAKRALEMGQQEEEKSILKAGTGDYRRAIRAAVRGLWSGEFDYDQFFDALSTAIEFHIPQAWYAGARECGVFPNELTTEEKAEIKRNIQYEKRWIDGFANAIEEGSKANGGKLGPLFARAEIWIGRWEGIRSQAMAMACKNRKLRWTLGESEHCESCLKLSGKVKRASYWYERGILPRVHGAWYLDCGGWRCQCTLEPTNEPASPGPLPSLP